MAANKDSNARDAISIDQIAAALTKLVREDKSKSSAKIPGFDYLTRVANTAVKTLAAQGGTMTDAWSEMKDGTYGVASAMKTWSKVMERSFDVFLEVSRGPGYRHGPTWLVIDDRQVEKSDTLEGDAAIDVIEPGDLDTTDFVHLGSGATFGDLYKQGQEPLADGSSIKVTLDVDAVRKVEQEGVFFSFIFPQSRGPSEPLVIVVLRTAGTQPKKVAAKQSKAKRKARA